VKEVKKSYKQMNRSEVKALVSRIKRINDCRITLSGHARRRMKERNINEEEIRSVFKNFNIVEFNARNNGTISALIRARNKGQHQISLSVDLSSGSILTVYKNHYKDHHQKCKS
jgi:hypothetical protein